MYDKVKRLIDISTALVVGLIFSPLILLICIAIKVDSEGPIIYKQRRVGKDGKIFYIWKFRSMYDKVDEKLKNNKTFMKSFKKKEGWKLEANVDPRITRVGRFTRKYSLDELPNLWNIFVGDMSMIGPRAYRNDDIFGDEIAEQLKIYPDLKKKLKVALSVKPGLTGPWQTSGRNELSWDKRVELDAKYATQKSLWQDFKILLKTPLVMFNKW
jgi:lipopolysaccharide/colanic/teichoic acid biosynthesis glycosyltransferase